MINKPAPMKGLHIRIPMKIPIKGREFINHGSGLFLGLGLGLYGLSFQSLSNDYDHKNPPPPPPHKYLCIAYISPKPNMT